MKTVAGHVPSADVQALATRVAACCRLLQMEGHLNYSGHVSARVHEEERLLIHPFLNSRASVRPQDIITCDLDGQMLSGPDGGRPPREVFIHTEIYRVRPDVGAIVHTHAQIAATFSIMTQPLVPVREVAYRWRSGVPVHPYPTHIDTAEKGRAMATTLGPHNALLLRSHGGVIVAEDLPAVLTDAVHFDENARSLMRALAGGGFVPLDEGELDLAEQSYDRRSHTEKVWDYYVDRGLATGTLDRSFI